MKKTDYEYALSIIVPVYNAEKYLEECIDSVISQGCEGCELILVDDGSTDRSGEICDSYAGFRNVKVLHKENGGSSSARNAGLERADGKYIAFLDSDDRISSNALPKIKAWISENDVDVCFMEAVCFFPDGRVRPLGNDIHRDEIRGKSRDYVFEHLSTRPKFAGSACTSLFRADFIKSRNLSFFEDRLYCEDLFFCLDCYLSAETFDALSFPYYEYRQAAEGSKTSKVSTKTFWGMASFVEYAANVASENIIPNGRIYECALSFAAYEYSIMLWQHGSLPKHDQDKAKSFLDEYNWIMKYGRNKKTKFIKLMHSIFGKSITSRMLNVYMTYR